jgi:hypothetical protein
LRGQKGGGEIAREWRGAVSKYIVSMYENEMSQGNPLKAVEK